MKTTVKERLISFLKYSKIGQKKFARIIGMSDGYVNAIRVSIQPDTLHKIAMCFPDLNTGWLMTGEGEMLKTLPLGNNSGWASYQGNNTILSGGKISNSGDITISTGSSVNKRAGYKKEDAISVVASDYEVAYEKANRENYLRKENELLKQRIEELKNTISMQSDVIDVLKNTINSLTK